MKINQEVKEYASAMGIAVVTIASVGVIALMVGGVTLALNGIMSPKIEQIRRNTYVQSESHVRGTVTQMRKLMVEYQREKDPAAKGTLAAMIKSESAEIPLDLMPADVSNFVKSLYSPDYLSTQNQ